MKRRVVDVAVRREAVRDDAVDEMDARVLLSQHGRAHHAVRMAVADREPVEDDRIVLAAVVDATDGVRALAELSVVRIGCADDVRDLLAVRRLDRQRLGYVDASLATVVVYDRDAVRVDARSHEDRVALQRRRRVNRLLDRPERMFGRTVQACLPVVRGVDIPGVRRKGREAATQRGARRNDNSDLHSGIPFRVIPCSKTPSPCAAYPRNPSGARLRRCRRRPPSSRDRT